MVKFEPTWESLRNYRCPEWFRDAKFGIWAHWGPQSVPMAGDWYARNMYIEGHPQYEHHVKVYGHPSKFGYKDIVQLWKAERFDPEALIDLYKSCGAKYFVSMGVHHDNFDLWNSKHHRWNAVNFGPKRDIVGEWARAARAAGLRFGVSEHLARSWSWFNTNKGCDKIGPYAGVPYDGNDPRYADFYFEPHEDTSPHYPKNPPEKWMRLWQRRIMDLIDQYDPDLLYTDGGVPFGRIGLELIAYFYNRNIERRGGKLEAVYTLKNIPRDHGEYREGIAVLDVERGMVGDISPLPWQMDTCIGGWFYDTRRRYKTPEQVIRILVDVVSKNGNLLLNIPQRPDGTLDEQAEWTVREIGRWLEVNGEAIYGTRPWRRFGEGPSAEPRAERISEREEMEFTCEDFRFTAKGDVIYAIALGRPDRERGGWLIRSLAGERAEEVSLLGFGEVVWEMRPEGLWVACPDELPCDYAWSIRIKLSSEGGGR
ncbi:alpha-L-fucosidase [Candidatus Poribacteria bacterium]|nr:MAG: alpha-L-fucosidase [Candidatus Poribacteria bacterium]